MAAAFLPTPAVSWQPADMSPWERGMALLLSGTDLVAARREFELLGERFGLSSTRRVLAARHLYEGEFDAAAAALTDAARLLDELGAGDERAEVLAELAVVHLRADRIPHARAALDEAWERADDPRTRAYLRFARAELLIRTDDQDTAMRELAAAETGFAGTAHESRSRLWCGGYRAMIALLNHDPAAARSALANDLDNAEPTDLTAMAHLCAAVASLEDDPERAAFLLGLDVALAGGPDLSGYDNLLRPAEHVHSYREAYDRGSALDRDAAVEALRSAT